MAARMRRIHRVVLGVALLAGCGSGPNKLEPGVSLVCSTSVDEACPGAAPGCDKNWSAVLTDPTYCGTFLGPTDQFYVYDCGDYHVLVRIEDAGTTSYYYAAASEVLVAAVGPNTVGAPVCVFGPLIGGFLPPDCGKSPILQMPASWCALDGGAAPDGNGNP